MVKVTKTFLQCMKSYPSLHMHCHITVIDHTKMTDVTNVEIEEN